MRARGTPLVGVLDGDLGAREDRTFRKYRTRQGQGCGGRWPTRMVTVEPTSAAVPPAGVWLAPRVMKVHAWATKGTTEALKPAAVRLLTPRLVSRSTTSRTA